MDTNSNQVLGTEKIWKLMFQLGIPSLIAQLINILYSIIDRIYIGHIKNLGALALTGVGITFPIVMLISAFSAFVGAGGASLAAIWMGKKDIKHAEKILGNGVFLLLTFTVILMLAFYWCKVPFLMMFGASENTLPYANTYISIYLIGTLFVELYLGLNSFIIAQGQSKTAMLSVLIGALLNTVLDPIFIFVFGWGVKGAAWATVFSQFVSAVWVVHFLTGKKTVIRIKPANIRPDFEIIKSILSLGISPFIMQSTESLISIVLNHGLYKYGGDLYVGSLTVLQSLMQFFTAPINGFTQGIQPIISYNYGAGNFDRVKKLYQRMIITCTSFLTFCTILIMTLPGRFVSLFTNDPELIGILEHVAPVFMCGMLVFGLQTSIQPTFLALGQAKISLFIATLRKIILLIPLALILPLRFGVMGIYYAEPIADICSAIVASALFCLNIRKILSEEALGRIK